MTAWARYGPRLATGEPDVVAYVGLGSNVGDRLAALQAAVEWIGDAAYAGASDIDTHVVGASPVYETEAHVRPGQGAQPDHLNAVVRLTTRATPYALLALLQNVERAAGRDETAPRWSPRPLDADLLLYGDLVKADREPLAIMQPSLVVPHPRLAGRRFVLAPLADLAPNLLVPGVGRTVADLLAECPDRARIVRTAFRLEVSR